MTVEREAPDRPSVVLAHDYLTEAGGAERVLAALATHLPDAKILTSAVRPDTLDPGLRGRAVQTSRLGPLFAEKSRAKLLFPLLPLAFRVMPVPDAAILLTSSSGFAHHLRPSAATLHAWYCHTPPRFLWDPATYFADRPATAQALRPLLALLRRRDLAAAARVDLVIANSRHTARRIQSIYGRDAELLWPPVPVDAFAPTTERSGRLLVLSRLLAYKRIDLAIAAAGMAGLPLDIVGDGPERPRLERLAGPDVRFLGRLPDLEARALLARCTALLVPGAEDLGITIVEAQASGRPPIAYAVGGALDTIEDGVTGHLVRAQDAAAFAAVIARSASADGLAAGSLVTAARRLDTPVFVARLDAILDRALATRSAAAHVAAGARA